MKILSALLVLLLSFMLSGCTIFPEMPDDPRFAPLAPESFKVPQSTRGSLYKAHYGLSLFDDLKAKNIGDILTVKLIESTDASKSSSTTLEKKTDANIANPTLLGSPVKFSTPKFFPLSSHKGNGLGASLSSDNSFEGAGNATQQNTLTGEIAVTVVRVYPNGHLLIRGEKWIRLNAGKEFIRLSGIIRPADIDEDNVVLSTKVANARISYSGTGQMQDTNFVGWLARFFNHPIWPF